MTIKNYIYTRTIKTIAFTSGLAIFLRKHWFTIIKLIGYNVAIFIINRTCEILWLIKFITRKIRG